MCGREGAWRGGLGGGRGLGGGGGRSLFGSGRLMRSARLGLSARCGRWHWRGWTVGVRGGVCRDGMEGGVVSRCGGGRVRIGIGSQILRLVRGVGTLVGAFGLV